MENLKISDPPSSKGLVVKFVIDNDYGGFYYSFRKRGFEIVLGFIALRVYFMSEARLEYFSSLVTLTDICTSHSITIKKESAGQEVGENKEGANNESI